MAGILGGVASGLVLGAVLAPKLNTFKDPLKQKLKKLVSDILDEPIIHNTAPVTNAENTHSEIQIKTPVSRETAALVKNYLAYKY